MGLKESKNEPFSSVVEGSRRTNSTAIFRHPKLKNQSILPKIWGCSNYFELFHCIAEKYQHKPWLGYRVYNEYQWVSFKDSLKKVLQTVTGICSMRIEDNSLGCKVMGIMAHPRQEWFYTDLACMGLGIATVGLTDSDQELVLLEKIRSLDMKNISVDRKGLKKLFALAEMLGESPIEKVLYFDEITSDEMAKAQGFNIQILRFKDFSAFPLSSNLIEISPKNICLFAFTSGVTGPAKAVKITHEQYMSSFTSIIFEHPPVGNDDVYILYTNLALHGERILSYMLTIYGVNIGFAGDLKEDIRIMKPTLMLAIPRVLDFLTGGIKHGVSKRTGLSGTLFKKCYENSLMKMEKGKPYKKGFWSNIAFREIRENFGGRLRFMLTGSSLSNTDTMKFISICLGCSIYEAYGLVETGYSSIYSPNTFSGCLGGPAPGWEAKLVFTPDIILEDIPKDMYGELWLRHDVASTSYLTQSTSDNDNWVHTGDLFKLTNERFGFCFIERIQYVMHTKCGFGVCPQRLENLYRQNPFVAQMIVYTDKSINGLVSIVVVDERTLHQKYTSIVKLEEVRYNHIIKQDIIDGFNELAQDKRLKIYEHILDVYIEVDPWTSSDLITESLKIKRYALLSKYNDCIQDMVSRLNN
ncbi:hypothetical protein SteCoe_17397 [Stentor coeruleus]|uniref:AMP-dependent synthetase/ligase domain-containing protein n=1 Tax=Stentor coeruleus TaxID=5963 RepID=A0A1R2BYZ8_9CILI|nr:hypothetical protein SteCoe_17397 [Stentor coeruleus]